MIFVTDECVSKARPQCKRNPNSNGHRFTHTCKNGARLYILIICLNMQARTWKSKWLIMARSYAECGRMGTCGCGICTGTSVRGSSRDGCKFIVSYLLDPMTVYSLLPLFCVMLCLTDQVSLSSGCVPQGSWHSRVPGRW